MVSIEKNSEIKNMLGDRWARLNFYYDNVKLSGARSRPWLDVGARIAEQWMFQILFEILFCKVIFKDDFSD